MDETATLLEQLNRYYMLWRESISMYEEWSKMHGLSYNNVMVLYSIYENKGHCTQTMISQKWLLPKQTIHTILKDFERRGLIEFSPSPSDKRNKIIHPTKAGEEYADRIITGIRRLEYHVLKSMGIQQVERMNNDFERFIELFQEGAKHAKKEL